MSDELQGAAPATPAAPAPASPSASAPETLPHQKAVLAWLSEQGYAVSAGTVHNHVHAGMLPRRGPVPERGRKVPSFLLRDVKRYAEDRLVKSASGMKRAETEESLARRKLEEETGRIAAHRERIELENARLKGALIPRDRVEMELAARAAQFKADGEGFFRGEASRLVALVGGDRAKTADLIEHCLAEFYAWLDRYAQPVDFVALVEDA